MNSDRDKNRKTGNRRPELLVPAGSPETLRVAIDYGADAVYLGGEVMSLRAKAKNFGYEEMESGIALAHENGVKVYVTANIYAHNSDLKAAEVYFDRMAQIRPDALLISDPGMFRLAKKHCPEVEIHISTQANNTNYETCRYWYEQGVKRIVLARELSLAEIREIRANIPEDLEIECFVHGAMCISYSGRCLLSNYFTGRDANHGACTHPCRWKYALVEETRPGEYLPIEEDDRGSYIMNSRDLCMVGYIPELAEAGIDSFKIEGRMKNALYVATVARTYRKAIDAYLESAEAYEKILPWLKEQIAQCTYRKYSTGFYFGRPDADGQIYDESTYVSESIYLGTVRTVAEDGRIVITQKNKFSVGDGIEIMGTDGTDRQTQVLAMYDAEGNAIESCPHAGMEVHLKLSECAKAGEVLRMAAKEE